MGSLIKYSEKQLKLYCEDLSTISSLSKLFSENEVPLIHYRSVENIYCSSFSAMNVSRSDSTVDAVLGKTGIGIKTFIESSKSQKIAEFNKQRTLYSSLSGLELIRFISDLRNKRIEFAIRLYGISRIIYHCVVRGKGYLKLYEEPMVKIDIDNIRLIKEDETKILFTDEINVYEFYFSKSTLFKVFMLSGFIKTINVEIIGDPMEMLKVFTSKYTQNGNDTNANVKIGRREELMIPLYSTKSSGIRFVGERSGLNQWNARGRARHQDEVYIPFPSKIRKEHPSFFPSRLIKWNLRLPDNKIISMKVCQQDDKALMSDPNKDLGKWILRKVLKLKPHTIVTYEMLLEIGIDSIVFYKTDGEYSVDFSSKQDKTP